MCVFLPLIVREGVVCYSGVIVTRGELRAVNSHDMLTTCGFLRRLPIEVIHNKI